MATYPFTTRGRRLRILTFAAAGALAIGGLVVASPADAAQARPKLTVGGAHSLINGDERTFAVDAPSTAKGAKISLQKASGKRWVTLQKRTANRKGDARFTLHVTGVGDLRYRATVAATRRFKASSTKSMSLSLSKWYYLADKDPVARGTLGINTEPSSLAGRSYSKPVNVYFADEWFNHGYAEYNLGYHCTRFTATVGLNDQDDVPVPATNTVLIDDASIGTYSTSTGQAAAVDLDVSGGFRITLDDVWDHSASTAHASGNVVWGNARVLCDADPSPSN